MTLTQYIKQEGGTLGAAYKIGVTQTTVYRWLSGESKPQGLQAKKLKRMGIEV